MDRPPPGMHQGVAWRVNAERLMLLAWSRAILLQLAHPLVAAGVAEHSTFRGGALAAVARLHHTVQAMLALTFGDPSSRERALDTIRAIHRRVHGHLPHAVGVFAAGTPYSAEDPALLLWVHATLLDSIVPVYDRVVSPLSTAERDAYCAEAAATAIALGALADDVPRTWGTLREYMETTLASGTIVVGPQARDLADAVLAPPMILALWPAARVNRLVTMGLLPPIVREEYGFTWDARRERYLDVAMRVIGAARRRLPAVVAWWPEALPRRDT